MRKQMNTTQEHEELTVYGVNDVASILGIGRDEAYALFKSPTFPSTRLGKKIQFITKANLIRANHFFCVVAHAPIPSRQPLTRRLRRP